VLGEAGRIVKSEMARDVTLFIHARGVERKGRKSFKSAQMPAICAVPRDVESCIPRARKEVRCFTSLACMRDEKTKWSRERERGRD
jgi:hypothetical protein